MSAYTKGLIVKEAEGSNGWAHGQYWIENGPRYEYGVGFKEEYISFNGYFGLHGPHVFAAAPELLESLELMLVEFADLPGMVHDERAACDKARAAIAKAKGETK